MPLTKQYKLVPVERWWRSSAEKVTTGLAESNGSLLPEGWFRKSPAGWLHVHWDQLRAQHLVTSMGEFLPLREEELAVVVVVEYVYEREVVVFNVPLTQYTWRSTGHLGNSVIFGEFGTRLMSAVNTVQCIVVKFASS